MITTLKTQINHTITFEVSESEARALEAMVGYGFDAFKNVFYEKLGKHYMQPHEAGLKSLFSTITKNVNKSLKEIDEFNKLLKKQ